MKIYFTLLIFLLASNANAQSNYVSTYLENPNMNAFELHALPWDETRMFQFRRNSSAGHYVYSIDEIAFNSSSSVIPPQCSEILQIPEILDDGLLIVGATSFGNELLYFDEVNSIVIDINVGAGDSDPLIYSMNDRVFVVAFDGSIRQLFEFNKTTHLITQITSSSINVESVCATWGGDILYKTMDENISTGEDDFHLFRAIPNGGAYAHELIQTISFPSSADREIDWRTPQLFNGNLYFVIINEAPNGSSLPTFPIGVININANNQISTSSLVLPNTDGEFFLVQWDGKLGVYSNLHDFFYISTNGQTFQSEDVPVDGRLVKAHVSENDELYFTCLYIDDTREVFEFDGGFQSRHIGEHLHFLSEYDDVLYYTDYVQFDSSSIVLLHTNYDFAEEVKVHFTFHPPHINSSTMFNGLFTFLFGSDGGFVDDNDIFQLTGSPSAGFDEFQIEMSVFPNPVNSGGLIQMRALRDGEVELINTSGNLLKQFNITNGVTQFNTSFLSSGVYFLSFMNHTQRIVVN